MKLTAHKNNIIFRFVDPVNNKGEFVRKQTSFGLELLSGFDNSAKTPRWCDVLAVGPDVKHVKVGNQILLPPLRWTERIEFEDERYWKTIEPEVVCNRSGKGIEYGMSVLNNFVLFKRTEPAHSVTASGLMVVGQLTDDTPTGKVFHVGLEAAPELNGATIYFDGGNFFDTVEDHVNFPFSFIKDESILAYSE